MWNALREAEQQKNYFNYFGTQKFNTQLTQIYGKKTWPDYEDTILELNQYTNAAEQIGGLVKDNPEGKVTANSAKLFSKHSKTKPKLGDKDKPSPDDLGTVKKINWSDVCQNCAQEGHKGNKCKYIPAWCDNCSKYGHMPRFCKFADGEYGDKEPASRRGASRVAKKWTAPQDEEGNASSEDSEEQTFKRRTGKKHVKVLKARDISPWIDHEELDGEILEAF